MRQEEENQEMSANGLISEALGLQYSYFVLKQRLEEVNVLEIERKSLITAGLTQSSNIILSFALEIALKGLLKFKFDNFPKTHNFTKLFNLLSEADKANIATVFYKKTYFDINQSIDQYQNMFMTWRYLELGNDHPHNSDTINEILNSIIEHYNMIKKD